MIKAPYLKKGDTIAIVSTAFQVKKNNIEFATSVFKSWGLKVKFGKWLYEKSGPFAGTDEQRAEDLQEMIYDENIQAIICARGGYGSIRIVQHINLNPMLEIPKWIVGFSDITVFHAYLNQHFKIATIHGAMPKTFGQSNSEIQSMDSLKNALFGSPVKYKIPSAQLNKIGTAKGMIVGGNLSLLYSLTGTPYDLDTSNKILFIEDAHEYLYHLDRMLMTLKLSGKLEHLEGLIVGGMTDMKDTSIPYGINANEIIWNHVKDYDFPICFDFPAGHMQPNLALKFCIPASMEIDKKVSTIKIER